MSRYSEEFKVGVVGYACAGHSSAGVCRRSGGPALLATYLLAWLQAAVLKAPVAATRANLPWPRFQPSWRLRRAVVLRRVRDGERAADLAASVGYEQTAVYN